MSRGFDRRSFLYAGATVLAFGQALKPVLSAFDHLLLGISDLDHGIDWFEQRSGVRALKGGVHPGQGTRNALVSLGGAHYLEIIAPDPQQSGGDRRAQVSALDEPRLINFAVRTDNIETTAASLNRAGVATMGPMDGSRRTASGALLHWKTLSVQSNLRIGEIDPVPFFIEWASDSIHPSRVVPRGCTIQELRFGHPRSQELSATFRAIGLEAKVSTADQVRIIAAIQSPKGGFELA